MASFMSVKRMIALLQPHADDALIAIGPDDRLDLYKRTGDYAGTIDVAQEILIKAGPYDVKSLGSVPRDGTDR